MKGLRVRAAVAAAGVLLGLLVSGTGRNGHLAASGIMTVLRCTGAVALVAGAATVTGLAVRAVSARRVTRVHGDQDEPPLPYHQPEPEPVDEDDAWVTLPPSRQAPALGLPGRVPASPPPARRRTMAPEPEQEEVPW